MRRAARTSLAQLGIGMAARWTTPVTFFFRALVDHRHRRCHLTEVGDVDAAVARRMPPRGKSGIDIHHIVGVLKQFLHESPSELAAAACHNDHDAVPLRWPPIGSAGSAWGFKSHDGAGADTVIVEEQSPGGVSLNSFPSRCSVRLAE